MAANTRKTKAGRADSILQHEDLLQAVVVADSFNVRFAPITLERPRALLPLVNCPLIDYTLEFLASAGMQEIFIICCTHSAQLKKHFRSSKWAHDTRCTVTPIVTEGCHSIGDVLREIERKAMMRSHFVLVTSDLVANVQLRKLVEQHKSRFKADKSAVMTLLFKQAFPGHRTRSVEDEIVVALDTTHRLLSYQQIQGKTKARFPLNLFQENKEMMLRYDLMHSHICICSPRVADLFVDNFDYQTMSDFIRGVLVNEEIEGNKLFAHIVDEYAARATSLPMYDSISKDVIRRWCHPLVPENLTAPCQGYTLGRHNVYLASNVTLERDSDLQEDVIIGQGTTIGTNTVISQSVIGKNCTIGENVQLENVYIWDDVTIESNCKLSTAIVCDQVCLCDSVIICPGCIVSFGVKVGPGITLPTGTLLTRLPPGHIGMDPEHTTQDDNADSSSTVQLGDVPFDTGVVGEEGEGYVWKMPLDEDEEEEGTRQKLLGLNISLEDEEEASSSDDSEVSAGEEYISVTPPLDDTKLFYNEVLDSVQRTIEENVKVENLILEVNSSKYAYNISMKELNQLVVKAILEVSHLKGPLPASQLLPRLKQLVKKMLPLFENYIKNRDSQLDCLHALEEYSLTCSATSAVLPKILMQFYEADILSEEAILRWYNSLLEDPPSAKSSRQHLRSQVQPFITWLEEAEEESDSDDDD